MCESHDADDACQNHAEDVSLPSTPQLSLSKEARTSTPMHRGIHRRLNLGSRPSVVPVIANVDSPGISSPGTPMDTRSPESSNMTLGHSDAYDVDSYHTEEPAEIDTDPGTPNPPSQGFPQTPGYTMPVGSPVGVRDPSLPAVNPVALADPGGSVGNAGTPLEHPATPHGNSQNLLTNATSSLAEGTVSMATSAARSQMTPVVVPGTSQMAGSRGGVDMLMTTATGTQVSVLGGPSTPVATPSATPLATPLSTPLSNPLTSLPIQSDIATPIFTQAMINNKPVLIMLPPGSQGSSQDLEKQQWMLVPVVPVEQQVGSLPSVQVPPSVAPTASLVVPQKSLPSVLVTKPSLVGTQTRLVPTGLVGSQSSLVAPQNSSVRSQNILVAPKTIISQSSLTASHTASSVGITNQSSPDPETEAAVSNLPDMEATTQQFLGTDTVTARPPKPPAKAAKKKARESRQNVVKEKAKPPKRGRPKRRQPDDAPSKVDKSSVKKTDQNTEIPASNQEAFTSTQLPSESASAETVPFTVLSIPEPEGDKKSTLSITASEIIRSAWLLADEEGSDKLSEVLGTGPHLIQLVQTPVKSRPGSGEATGVESADGSRDLQRSGDISKSARISGHQDSGDTQVAEARQGAGYAEGSEDRSGQRDGSGDREASRSVATSSAAGTSALMDQFLNVDTIQMMSLLASPMKLHRQPGEDLSDLSQFAFIMSPAKLPNSSQSVVMASTPASGSSTAATTLTTTSLSMPLSTAWPESSTSTSNSYTRPIPVFALSPAHGASRIRFPDLGELSQLSLFTPNKTSVSQYLGETPGVADSSVVTSTLEKSDPGSAPPARPIPKFVGFLSPVKGRRACVI